MEDTNLFDSVMDGQPYRAGHHATTLRRLLWREHLGLLPAQTLDATDDPNAQPPDVCPNDIMDNCPEYEFVADPLSDQVWDMWTGNATTNTDLFRHLFRADPDDNSMISPFFCSLSIDTITSLTLLYLYRILCPVLPKHLTDMPDQSKPSMTTLLSSRATTNSNKAICTIHSWTHMKFAPSSIRSRAIWYGCRLIS